MAYLVYILCAVTSLACSVLLFRAHRQQRVRLLFWSGLCFAGFALGNAMLILDVIMGPSMDMSLLRSAPVLAGLLVLIYGLVVEAN